MIIKNLEDARILAKDKAQKDREDQIIFPVEKRGFGKGFAFTRKTDRKGGIEVVRYTPEDIGGEILRDNGDGEPISTTKGSKKAKVPRPAEDLE